MLIRLGLIAIVVFVVFELSSWAMKQTASAEGLSMAGLGVLALLLVTYAVLIAVPFVPGVEIGVALMVVQGAAIAPFVFLATVAGLMLAYVTGCLVSYDRLHRLFADLRLQSACLLLDHIGPLPAETRLHFLAERLPRALAPLATRYRYVALALLINLPGNSLLGGGGGLCMIAGLSRVFRPGSMLLTLLVAVLPVPLIVWFTGSPLTWFVG